MFSSTNNFQHFSSKKMLQKPTGGCQEEYFNINQTNMNFGF